MPAPRRESGRALVPGHTLPTAAAPVRVAMGLAVRDGVLAVLPDLTARASMLAMAYSSLPALGLALA